MDFRVVGDNKVVSESEFDKRQNTCGRAKRF